LELTTPAWSLAQIGRCLIEQAISQISLLTWDQARGNSFFGEGRATFHTGKMLQVRSSSWMRLFPARETGTT
jgi:hypothetical protein